MKLFKVVNSQTEHDLDGDPFEAESLEQAQKIVLEGEGLEIAEITAVDLYDTTTERDKLLASCKRFRTFYISLLVMNPEAGMQLMKIIPVEIKNQMEEAIKYAEDRYK